jgi:hypothetical protein
MKNENINLKVFAYKTECRNWNRKWNI